MLFTRGILSAPLYCPREHREWSPSRRLHRIARPRSSSTSAADALAEAAYKTSDGRARRRCGRDSFGRFAVERQSHHHAARTASFSCDGGLTSCHVLPSAALAVDQRRAAGEALDTRAHARLAGRPAVQPAGGSGSGAWHIFARDAPRSGWFLGALADAAGCLYRNRRPRGDRPTATARRARLGCVSAAASRLRAPPRAARRRIAYGRRAGGGGGDRRASQLP
mmetsp:Transcript_58009/g.133251  ORF Transcript_58009/g.133251 Transcript_58009/m.133251 type:complete len:223 (+) Transcript_58009:572-1240(+)